MVRIDLDLPNEVADRLQQEASARGVEPEQLIAEALREMLDDRQALASSVARGRQDFEAGRSHDHAELVEELDAWAIARKLMQQHDR